jgi:hypothetical protein
LDVSRGQGDRMSLRKNRRKCSATHLCQKLKHNLHILKKEVHSKKAWVSFVIFNFQKPAQSKQSPIGRKIAQSGHPGRGRNARSTRDSQGCQMVCFQTKNPNLGKFWRALEWKMLVYFMVIWDTLRQFGLFYGHLII